MQDLSGSTELKPSGVGYRQDELEAAAGGRTEDGHDQEVVATLKPVDDNPHDRNAIEVRVDGHHVGFVPAELAAGWHGKLKRVGGATCRARIVGGWDRGGNDQGNFGLRLYLDPSQLDGAAKPWWKRWWAIILGVIIVLAILGGQGEEADASEPAPFAHTAAVDEDGLDQENDQPAN